MIFVNKGDMPLTPVQLENRAQKYISRSWSTQAREESIRKGDGLFDAFMTEFSANHAVNKENNTFNAQLSAYKQAVARLEQVEVAVGRDEVTEMQVVGQNQVGTETVTGTKYLGYDEDGNEITEQVTSEVPIFENVLEEVVVQSAIEPVEPTVEITVYGDDPKSEPTVETIENPLITQDNLERAEAQAVVDVTPQAVKEAV